MGVPTNCIDCTTLAALKVQLSGIASDDTRYDAALSQIISAVSLGIQNFIGSPLSLGTRTEEHSVVDRQPVLFLRAVPVTSVSSVKVSTSWEFASTSAMTSTDYRVDSATGQLYFNRELADPDTSGLYPGSQPLGAQVVYIGGYAETTSALIASYQDFQSACHLWAAAIWRQRQQPLAMSERISDASVARGDELHMPKAAAELLWPYKRFRF